MAGAGEEFPLRLFLQGGVFMLVTNIEKKRNKEPSYAVFIDGQQAFYLCATDIAYFKLKPGQEIKEDVYEYICENLLYIKAQEAALHFIGFKARTEWEVERKLMQEDYTPEVIERVLLFLKKYQYINDKTYCEAYIRQSQKLRPRGSRLLSKELKERGISDSMIEQVLDMAELDETGAACQLLLKKTRGFLPQEEKEKRRLYAFLQRKGFSFETIKEAWRKAEGNEDFF